MPISISSVVYDTFGCMIMRPTSMITCISLICSIGQTVKGHDINVLKITSHAKRAAEPKMKPRVAIVGGIHGNEAVTTEIAVIFADYLIKRHHDDVSLHDVSVLNAKTLWGRCVLCITKPCHLAE